LGASNVRRSCFISSGKVFNDKSSVTVGRDFPTTLVQIVRTSKLEDKQRLWEAYKKGEVKTVREAKKRKAGEDITAPQPQPKKPKQVFETTQKASVIVQSETLRLT
jgi:hypothetical protein